MPGGMEYPAPGYAAYCGVKFVGYSLFAAYLHRTYRAGSLQTIRKDAQGRMVEDTACPQCGYNLRMLTA